MEAQKSNRNGVFKVEMRQKDRNKMIKIVLQTWMWECDSNKVESFLLTSPVRLIFTDLYLCRVCHYIIISSFAVLLLNVHPECIRHVKLRDAYSQGLYTGSSASCECTEMSWRIFIFFFVNISSGLGSSPAHISVQSCWNRWPFIAAVWCIRSCIYADTCTRTGSNFRFLFVKRLD